jgi:hypothetical protein
MTEAEEQEIVDRIGELLPDNPQEKLRVAGMLFAVVGVSAGFSDVQLFAQIIEYLVMMRAARKEASN